MTSPATRRLRTRAASALLVLGWAGAAVAAPPTLHSITIDGSFVDWADILNNPSNVGIDGVGAGVACGLSDDLDCPVTDGTDDLRRLAWTAPSWPR